MQQHITLKAVNNATGATLATANAIAVATAAKLVISSSFTVAVSPRTRNSDNAFVVAIGIIAVAVAAAYHFNTVNTAMRATLGSANAIDVATASKLVSSSSFRVAVSPCTRNIDNAFVVAIVAKLHVGVTIAAQHLQ